jgi:ribosome-binding factor A
MSPSTRFSRTSALSMAFTKGQRGRGGTGQSQRASIRQARVARSIRDEISEIITDIDIKAKVYPDEDLLRATSVAEVEVSPDLSYAKIFISVLGNSVEKRQIYVWLCENVGQVRYSLAKRLRHMRRIPELTFKLANNQAAADLVSLIEDLTPSSSLDDEDYEDYEDFDEDLDE